MIIARMKQFLVALQRGEVLVADGATGTMLQSMGLDWGQAPEAWLLEQPDKIWALHRAYVEAGSDVILTCSFGGTHFRLGRHGLGERVTEVNRVAAELAREVAGDRVFVAGDMGPTGQLLGPRSKVTAEQVADAFAQQAEGLVQGGVDFLVIETMSDVGEAQAAIAGARRVSELPIFCTFSFDTHGRTMMGVKPEQAAQAVGPLVQGVGANCGHDPAEYEGLIQAMHQAQPEAILWAKPNAGLPRLVDDVTVYDATPEYMAEIALRLRRAGAQVIGGCCGTTPAHIRAIAAALRGGQSGQSGGGND
jgi:5-methyltetrahydrofolate--homocysteine methyltransferase